MLYDPDKVSVTWNGIECKGYSADDFIAIKRDPALLTGVWECQDISAQELKVHMRDAMAKPINNTYITTTTV